MRNYSRLSSRFWTGASGRAMRGKPHVQLVALYLISAPGSSWIGIFYVAVPAVAHELGLTIAQVREAVDELGRLRVAHYDNAAELVWIPEMARWQIAETLSRSDSKHKGVVNDLMPFLRIGHPFAGAFLTRYKGPFNIADGDLPGPQEAPSRPPIGPLEGVSLRSDPIRPRTEPAPGGGEAVDPLTVSGLITLVRAAMEREHPKRGFYNPGRWASDRARCFLEAIPDYQRTDTMRAEIRTRIEVFVKSRDRYFLDQGWKVEAFTERYMSLGKNSAADVPVSARRGPWLPPEDEGANGTP